MRGTLPSTTIVILAEETPYTSVKQYLEEIPVNKGTSQVEPLEETLRMREASQKDALASGRHFLPMLMDKIRW